MKMNKHIYKKERRKPDGFFYFKKTEVFIKLNIYKSYYLYYKIFVKRQ